MASDTHMTPAKYATARALRPALVLIILSVGFGIFALGKLSWAVKAYDLEARYDFSVDDR